MKRLSILFVLGLAACAQADADQYKCIGEQPVYGETNGLCYDATNDRLAWFVNDTEVAYITSAGNYVVDGTIGTQTLDPDDDAATCFGTSDDACFEFNAADMAPDSMVIGVGTESRQLIIGETADVSGAAAVDLAIAQQTNPTLNIHSADGTDTSQYVTIAHDQTNAIIDAGTGSIVLSDNAVVGVAGAGTDYTLTFNGETNDCTFTCMEDEARLDVEGNLQFGTGGAGVDYTFTADGETNDGTITWMEDEADWRFANDIDANGDIFAGGGTGALTFDAAGSTVVMPDNSGTALGLGLNEAAGALMLFDTTNSNEEVNIVGTTATSAFRVDTGFATFDEQAVFSAGMSVAGGAIASAITGSDILTLTGAAPTITLKDNEAAALNINSSGTTNFILVDTTTGAEELNLNGDVGVSVFRVDQGIATFDEQAVLTAGADCNGDLLLGGGAGALTVDAASGSILMSGAADNVAAGLDIGSTGATSTMRFVTTDTAEGVTLTLGATGSFLILASGSAGWLDAASGNQACNTTCAGTGACLFGFDAGASTLVDCADATADQCICGGPIS